MIEAGDPGRAAELLEKLAAEMPGYATARVLLARSYERLNDWQPALRAWREAHQIIPNSPVVRRGLERAARKASSRSPIESPPAEDPAPLQSSAPPPADTTDPADTSEAADTSEPADTAEPDESAARDSADNASADLDRLINELESARIVPRPDLDEVPPPDLEDDIEDVVSETLARIYASQGQYDEAAHVYELLAEQQPEKADEFAGKASEMRAKASEQE